MNLNEAILALLKAAFSGVREDGLKHLAAAIGLQVTTEEEAKEVVGKLTAGICAIAVAFLITGKKSQKA